MAFDMKDAGAVVETSAGDDGIIMAAPSVASPRPAPYKWSALWAYIQSKAGSALGYDVGTAEGNIPALGAGGKLPHAQMNLANLPLTGIPTAPTASAGTNTQQLATTAFVRGEVTSLINAAPGALDTLDELAAALGDDANFATTVTNALALKAPLASPPFTGIPTAPTATLGTNTQQLATTAFVQSATALTSRRINSAADVLGPEEGFAADAISQTAVIFDRSGAKNNTGTLDDILTVSRASTKTVVGRNRLLETVAVNAIGYDQDPVTGVPKGALFEPAATNLTTYSEQLGSWTTSNVSVTSDATTAPDGATTADLITITGTSDPWLGSNSSGSTVATTHSMWVKQGTAARARFRIITYATPLGDSSLFYDFAGGTFSGDTGSFTSYSATAYANGWVRVIIAAPVGTSQTSTQIRIVPATSSNTHVNGETLYAWGVQSETGTYATSYIPTTSATVTRAADSVSIATSLIPLDATQGTLFVEYEKKSDPTTYGLLLALDAASISRRTGIYWNADGTHGGYAETAGYVNSAILSIAPVAIGSVNKIAFSYRANDFKAVENGGSVLTDASGGIEAPTLLSIGGGVENPVFSVYVRRVAYISRALTSTELQALTA